MPSVMLSGVEFPTFAGLTTADEYLMADARYAVTWPVKTDEERSRLLVSATRAMQALRWRDDVDVDPEGSPPAVFGPACILFAAEGLVNPGVFSARDTGAPVLESSAKAGPVETSKKFGAVKAALPVPNAVHRLIASYLAGAGVRVGTGVFRGGSKPAQLSDDFGYTGPVG